MSAWPSGGKSDRAQCCSTKSAGASTAPKIPAALTIQERNTLANDGMTYQGTFVYRFFHPDGSLGVEIKGTLTAARITADRRDMLLEGWVQPLSRNELCAAPVQTKPLTAC